MVYKFDGENQLVSGRENGEQTEHLAAPPARVKVFDVNLREKLGQFRIAHGHTNRQLANLLGVNSTAVSKYLSGKPEGDVVRLESAIEDVLKNTGQAEAAAVEICEGEFWRRFSTNLDTIKKTNDMGGITGEAGIGKTECCKLYFQKNPTSVFITASAWRRDRRSIEGLLWNAVTTRRWSRGTQARGEFLVEKFRDSNRLIIVDNAHRLTRTGLAFFFDFHDETNCPVVFIGNPEFLEVIRGNDQMFSRLGLFTEVVFRDAELLTDHLLDLYFGKEGRALRKVAHQVIAERGHARSLKKQLQLTRELASRKPGVDLVTHFRAAHTHLVRNYKLLA